MLAKNINFKKRGMDFQVLDNELQEEGGKKNVRWAGFWIRVAASLIDFMVYIPVMALSMYNINSIKNLPLQLLLTLILGIYKPLMEYKFGATLGKMGVGIKVVDLNFNRISALQAIKRYFPWLISHIISIYGTIVLFQHPDFLSTTNWIEVGNLQNDILSKGLNYAGSGITLVSCLVVAFTATKQGLHDMLAETYCIYK